MKKSSSIPFSFSTVILLCPVFLFGLLMSDLQAQNRVTIKRAQEVIGQTVTGEQVRKLIGNVHLETKDLTMYCDSAYQYLDQSKIRAFSNIEIQTEEEIIWADTVNYLLSEDRSEFIGRVVIKNDSTTLFGDRVNYLFEEKIAHFTKSIRLEDPEGTLRAQSGYYYQNNDSATFFHRVQVADSSQYIEGDSLFVNRESESYKLFGNLFVNDRENHSILSGRYLESDSTGRRLLEDSAYVRTYEEDEPDDTTHIQSETILFTKPDTVTYITASRQVRVWSPDFSAIGDTLYYTEEPEFFRLVGSPVAWHKRIQLTAPNIKVGLTDGKISSLLAYPKPFAVQQDTVLNRHHQIKGDSLRGYFTQQQLSHLVVYPKSHILYHSKDENDEPDGAIELTATRTDIYFKEGDIDRMKSKESIDGIYLPETQQLKKKRLEGYAWNPDQRPNRPADPPQQKWMPIPDERPFTLPKRYVEFLEQE